ncbi:hypothetical protein CWB73_14680 [Pseudoalteromonas phenolica]|uniref:Uncharacterized protein n=2 Tax=Pseudoalteromonas phenolica TaxID=161398 RepID=A0A5S3YSD8_9GAMM|nr:hypothetical protein CWB73_14680 [Pseudoalteromonas phenolica]
MDNYGITYFGIEIYWDLLSGFFSMHFVTWLLFLVMLTNYVRTSKVYTTCSVKAERKEVFKLSAVVCCSYALMIPIEFLISFFDFYSRYFPYTVYLLLDICTLLLIFFCIELKSVKAVICRSYITLCLSCNSIFFLLLQVDLLLMHNSFKPFEAWWFWDVFTIGVNFFDGSMILILLIQKDIFLLDRLNRRLKLKPQSRIRAH